MRKLLLSSSIIVLAVVATPYVDGLIFKKQYLNLVDQLQQLQFSPQVKTQIDISDYHVGWLTSTADIKVTATSTDPKMLKYGIPPLEFHSKLLVNHGPIVFHNTKPVLALASMQQSIFLPPMLKGFISESDQGFIQFHSIMKLNSQAISSTMSIQPVSFGSFAKWDGATGNGDISINIDGISNMTSTAKIGRLDANIPMIPLTLTINPINATSNMSFDKNEPASMNLAINMTGASANSNGKTIFSLQGLNFTEDMSATINTYSFMVGTKINGLTLQDAGNFSSIPQISYSISVADIDKKGVKQLKDMAQTMSSDAMSKTDDMQIVNAYLNLLTNSSKIQMALSGNTNLGSGSSSVSISFTRKPKDLTDVIAALNYKVEMKIARKLLTEILTQGLSYSLTEKYHHTISPTNPESSTVNLQQTTADYQTQLAAMPQATTNLIDGWIKQGMLVQEGDNIILTSSKNGDTVSFNGLTDSPVVTSIKQLLAHPDAAVEQQPKS